jgi:hypothetical protein
MILGEINIIDQIVVVVNTKYMMATQAMTKNIKGDLIDVTRKKPQICRITGKTDKYWVGNWVFEPENKPVFFIKKTTRLLRKDQKIKYNNLIFSNGHETIKIKL